MLGLWVGLAGLIAIVAVVALPERASAAACPVNPGSSTTWIGGSGSFNDANNWSNGGPSSSCDAFITSPGSDMVTMTSGANVKSLTLGGLGSTPILTIKAQSPNTNLDAQPAGITIAAGASVILTCEPPPTGCLGGSSGGAHLSTGAKPLLNAGTIRVDSNSGTGAIVDGVITNTGTIAFENSGGAPYSAGLGGQVTNQGVISVGNGGNVVNQGSSCGGTEPFVKNDAGGTIGSTGTGVLSVINFEQGDGTTEDVFIPCGGLKYSGTGASEVRAGGGFNLTGEMRSNQSLTISAESNNTNAVLQGDFTNKGSITLTCPAFGCSGSGGGGGGGAGFNANGHVFTNAGAFTFGTGSGTDAGTSGGMTNTGAIQFDQSGFLSGVVTNKGTISVANGKVATSSTGSCGDPGPRVINDTGGNIVGVGTGTLSAVNFEQGAGTTSGTAPVTMNCGSLKYVGTGASTVRVPTSATMTGNLAAGQVLSIAGQVNSGAFTNAGTIVFDQSASSPTLNTGTVTNVGKIGLSGPSANTSSVTGGQLEQTGAGPEIVVPAGTKLNPGAPVKLIAGTLRGGGTIAGSVENTGGVVSPGASPGTLTLTGSFVQGPGGRLDIEVAGTGVGQFDSLAVGGVATLGGTLALIPAPGYADSSAVGDSVSFLSYGGSLLGGFSATTVNPALSCGKAFSIGFYAGAKALKANVVVGGTACPDGGAATPATPPAPVPPIPAIAKKPSCPKGKQLKKGKCVKKTCPKGKKPKRGRCVKKKQPKARSRRP
jgi:hypothetical protein